MPIAIALAISALLHATAVSMPGWELPGLSDPEPAAIEAHLAPPPAPAVVPRERPNLRPSPRPRRNPSAPPPIAAAPAPEAVAPVPEASAPAVEPPLANPVEAPATSEPVAEPPPPPPPVPVPPWAAGAATGRIRYIVYYGENGFMIGEAIHEWRLEAGRYFLRSTAEPKGLAALRGRTRSQSSEGDITADGLRPRTFRDQREGREAETVSFDWENNRAAFAGGRGEGILPPGAQDMLSVFYQLAWRGGRRTTEIPVATTSRIGRSTFEWIGEETLDLPAGPVATLHLRARAGDNAVESTEVWLAPAHGGLPVKIRHTDRKGDTYDQVADKLELDP
ncbi:MAG: DUF3108 domain-containing protein [Candidatus Nitricoxidivorans perseverans]|uniref:DUF3108 domain-containing protein n=1 Tax=Candidatus Nitricoxidivorans perseverans TaxID=2975601 RepID=A0AA49FNE0_9PROT|nr:MAG: DUF3108 domain-containing protein [Candidatus Nitricoxidivorans perseverans]